MLPEGRRVTDVMVAAYDLDANVAVLKIPETFPDSLIVGEPTVDAPFLWTFTHPNCEDATATRVEVLNRSDDELLLNPPIPSAHQGGPALLASGDVVGLTDDSTTAVNAQNAAAIIELARTNIASRQLVSAGDVARRELHLYGAVTIQSDVADATARVTPLESWHWPELARTDIVPFTFFGPTGRYTVELQGTGGALVDEFTILSGITGAYNARLADLIAQAPVEVSGGGGFPMPVAIGGGVVAAGALVFLLAGGGGENGNGNGNGQIETGQITIRLPN
jgi:hypothetical protein